MRALREGLVDLEVGVLGEAGPEVRVQALFRDRFVGVARKGHPLLASGEITPERYAACNHVVASRRSNTNGPVDQALAALGLRRTILVVVPGFSAALAIAKASDLVALVTASFHNAATEGRHEGTLAGLSATRANGADHGVADMASASRRRPRPPLAPQRAARGLPDPGRLKINRFVAGRIDGSSHYGQRPSES